jgi:Fe-S cluster assembly protein SufD
MDITLVDPKERKASYLVKEGESLTLNLALFDVFSTFEIDVDVERDAHFLGAVADFASGEGKFILNVHLKGEGSSAEVHSAVLAKGDSKKVYETSVYHEAPHTSGLMSNYGITRDASRLTFSGVSEIKRYARSSETHQAAKIIVFDPECDGKCQPILNIDENDVVASHAAVVGKLNDEHLFYMLSRGIDEESAKRLITLGYLKPVEQYFVSEDVRKKIDEAIEGGI